MQEVNRKGVVTKRYQQPFRNAIKVHAGERVSADFQKGTDIQGWLWCTDERGCSGWTPQMWLVKQGAHWRITRDFDAIELAVETRLAVTVHFKEAGFYWLTAEDGRPAGCPQSM